MRKPKVFVCIAGSIGAGKTTLTQMLSDVTGLKAQYENFAENPFLKNFYTDMKRWSFPSQMFYLKERIKQVQSFFGDSRILADRSLYEDAEIFAKNLAEQKLMSAEEWQVYEGVYQFVRSESPIPDLMIYLRASPNILQQRIARRARGFEDAIPTEYLQALHQRYERWFESYALGPKLLIDTDTIDFVHNQAQHDDVLRICLQALRTQGLLPHLA